MYVTSKEIDAFKNEPIEFIGNQYDFTETTYNSKNQVVELLCILMTFSS